PLASERFILRRRHRIPDLCSRRIAIPDRRPNRRLRRRGVRDSPKARRRRPAPMHTRRRRAAGASWPQWNRIGRQIYPETRRDRIPQRNCSADRPHAAQGFLRPSRRYVPGEFIARLRVLAANASTFSPQAVVLAAGTLAVIILTMRFMPKFRARFLR